LWLLVAKLPINKLIKRRFRLKLFDNRTNARG
jgi:hypothetical protein